MKCANIVCAIIMIVGLLSRTDILEAHGQSMKVQTGGGSPYTLIGTEVWDVPDPLSKRAYQVFVSLPASYQKEPSRRYPVLFVTDATYAFPVISQISRRLNVEHAQIQDFILVGLSYGKGEDGTLSRDRDYTPTPNGPSDTPAGAVLGHGPAYQAYLRDHVMPFIAQHYRTDPRRTLFLGHSYGALLGAQILFTDPGMFSGYILGSPSLWYDKHHIFVRALDNLQAAQCSRYRDRAAHPAIGTGASPDGVETVAELHLELDRATMTFTVHVFLPFQTDDGILRDQGRRQTSRDLKKPRNVAPIDVSHVEVAGRGTYPAFSTKLVSAMPTYLSNMRLTLPFTRSRLVNQPFHARRIEIHLYSVRIEGGGYAAAASGGIRDVPMGVIGLGFILIQQREAGKSSIQFDCV